MKYFVLTLAFAALTSAKLLCNAGITQPTRSCNPGKDLYCCVERDETTQIFNNERTGCGDPKEGTKLSCGTVGDATAL
ncbi:hypothetical protein BUE80_DR002284 [Diplocarpon rosae]|nr:hypothetical protein BUE80_DR002284 [Diplocarpon rosae]